MMRQFTLTSASLALVLACCVTAQAQHTTDSLNTVKSNLKEKKAVLLDVREKAEWDAGHIQGAKLVPLSALRKDAQKIVAGKKLNKETICYTHCKAGVRALYAAKILKEMGFDVRPLKPGYDELVKNGFPKAEKKD